MLKSVFRYLIPALLLFPAIGLGYLTVQFVLTPLTGVQTLMFLAASSVVSIAVFVLSLPQIEDFFLEKTSSTTQVYWVTVLAIFLISVGLAYLSVSFVGVEYTEFMAQNASG